MPDPRRKYIRILKIELEDLREDLEVLCRECLEREQRQEISHYVSLENLAVLKHELLGVGTIAAHLDRLNLDDYASVDELVTAVDEICHKLVHQHNLEEAVYLLWTATAWAAGLAEKGLHGLMITPQFGPMQRWSVVATDASPLPDREPVDMGWLPEFCNSCHRCIEACPAGAVLEEPIPRQGDIVTHIDNERCYPYFARYRGCSICLRVCADKLREEGRITE